MPKGVYARGPRVPKVDPPELVTAIRECYLSGMTQEEVAADLGITRKVVENVMRRQSIQARPQIKRDQRGPNNATWRGDRATYAAAHYRVYAVRGQPSYCEDCGTTDPTKRYEWANLTKNYTDPMDYRRLCGSCHSKFDRQVRNLGAYAVRKEVRAL